MERAHDALKYAAAVIAAPIMKRTGFRFSKAWRGNPFIAHVTANLLADGVKPGRIQY